jgi:CRP/FNR family cyclic AMP-dependent transcriptional regulator
METLERILAEHPFSRDLKKQYAELLVGCATNVRFEAGEFLFHEGDEANQFYLIRHGVVAVEIVAGPSRETIITTIGEGEVLGWSWLFPP